MTNRVTMTAEEAEALYQAAQAYRQNLCNDADEWKTLNRAINKFRRATTLVIEEE
jgi:hypothetical protein